MSIAFILLTAVVLGCGDKGSNTGSVDGGAADDGGVSDGGDGGTGDGGTGDGGTGDGGTGDGGTGDGGTGDGGMGDGGTGDGGTGDGGMGDGGTGDGGMGDGGMGDGGSSDFTLSSGRYLLSVGALIEDTCVSGGSGEAIPAGSTAPGMVTVKGTDLTIEIGGGADITLTGTVDAGMLRATQVTSTDYTPLGFDCLLQYTWWIDGTLTADDSASGSIGLEYTPIGGKECDDLAAADGWTLPCGWSSEASMEAVR